MSEQTYQNVAKQIKVIRKYIKLKIIEDNVSFRDHTQERNHVYDLIKRTVSHGESHSALMIGPKGSGKTTLINSVLHQLSQEVDLENDAYIVKLNGLIHNDEKVALKSITAQLQLENAVGDKVFGSFAENLAFLISCLQSGSDRQCKSMVFVLEQMDLFCRTGRAQTLLYNLFDITNGDRSPVCVIGVTNHLDVMELLEKRVKSRFSHRHIFIFSVSGDRTPVEYYTQVLVQMLSIPAKKTKPRGRKSVGKTIESEFAVSEEVLHRCNVDPKELDVLNPAFVEDWNEHIQALADSQQVMDSIEKLCYYTVNEQSFKNVLVVSRLSPNMPYIESNLLTSTIDNATAPQHTCKLLQSLSILELSLVIAMKHGMEIFDGQPMNFEMVLHRYTKFANTNSSTQTVPRPVILKAFEHLQALEIILPVKTTDSIYNATETTASRVQKEYKLYSLNVPTDDITEAVKNFKALPTEISHWYNSSGV